MRVVESGDAARARTIVKAILLRVAAGFGVTVAAWLAVTWARVHLERRRRTRDTYPWDRASPR